MYSLKTLSKYSRRWLLVVAPVALVLSLYLYSVVRQQLAVKKIESMYGAVEYQDFIPANEFLIRTCGRHWFQSVSSVYFDFSESNTFEVYTGGPQSFNFDEYDLRFLRSVPYLRSLGFSQGCGWSQYSDDLKYLAAAKRLEVLRCPSSFSSEDAKHLRFLLQLKRLHAGHHDMGEEAVSIISHLENLTHLELAISSSVSEPTIRRMGNLSHLKYLRTHSRLSGPTVEHLKEALPDCTIYNRSTLVAGEAARWTD